MTTGIADSIDHIERSNIQLESHWMHEYEFNAKVDMTSLV